MVTVDDVRRLALTLPRTEEHLIADRVNARRQPNDPEDPFAPHRVPERSGCMGAGGPRAAGRLPSRIAQTRSDANSVSCRIRPR